HLKIPGCVAIDVRSCFMGFYFKAEKSSLTFYLNESGLKSKLDMPIHHMNKYYERALNKTNVTTAKQMREVAKYCIIDAISCQQLMVKHNAINEYREIASIAFLSLFDVHYFAGGMKVCNHLGVNFASLYPSLIMTYNLSPDKMILSQEHAESLKKSGKKLHEINFKFNDKETSHLFERKKEDMKLVIGLMGKDLLLSEVIEHVLAKAEKEKCDSLNKNLYYFINKEKHKFMAEYDSVCFDYSCFNTQQNAIKVYMNSFYSTAGNSKSPFFLRELAGSVTSAGQKNNKLVADFIESKGFQKKYGDTDSLYLVCPEECF
ncbi:1845_t:CDS:2, partial [Funneliformis geosporum]